MSASIRRSAFTMVELLVVMSIVVLLATLTLAVVVNMGERDGTTDAAGLTRQWLMIAKNRAARDHANRGLRLIIGTDPNNPAKTNPYWVTELQYIEQPPPYQPNPNGTSGPSDAHLSFFIPIDGTSRATSIQCQVRNLTASDVSMIQPGCWLAVAGLSNDTPAFGTRVLNVTAAPPQVPPLDLTKSTLNLILDRYPNSSLGASGGLPGTTIEVCRSYSFSVTLPPQSILGEPPLQLPKNICIDVTQYPYVEPYAPNDIRRPVPPAWVPPGPPPPPPSPPYYVPPCGCEFSSPTLDILFTPNGTVLPVGVGVANEIYLWHRDYTKLTNAPRGNHALVVLNDVPLPPYPPRQYDLYPFHNGGVQQIVAIRCKTGSLGQFPVAFPDEATGFGDPFMFARQGATSP